MYYDYTKNETLEIKVGLHAGRMENLYRKIPEVLLNESAPEVSETNLPSWLEVKTKEGVKRLIDDFIIVDTEGLTHLPRFDVIEGEKTKGVLFGSFVINPFPYKAILNQLPIEYPYKSKRGIILRNLGRLHPFGPNLNTAMLDGYHSIIDFDDVTNDKTTTHYHNSIRFKDGKFTYFVHVENTYVVYSGNNANEPWNEILADLKIANPNKTYPTVIDGNEFFGFKEKEIYTTPIILYNMMEKQLIRFNVDKCIYETLDCKPFDNVLCNNTLIFKKEKYYWIRIFCKNVLNFEIDYSYNGSFFYLNSDKYKYIIQNSLGECHTNSKYSNIYRWFNKSFLIATFAIDVVKEKPAIKNEEVFFSYIYIYLNSF